MTVLLTNAGPAPQKRRGAGCGSGVLSTVGRAQTGDSAAAVASCSRGSSSPSWLSHSSLSRWRAKSPAAGRPWPSLGTPVLRPAKRLHRTFAPVPSQVHWHHASLPSGLVLCSHLRLRALRHALSLRASQLPRLATGRVAVTNGYSHRMFLSYDTPAQQREHPTTFYRSRRHTRDWT